MREAGVKRLFLKRLSPRQDNEKNQIFLSTNSDGLVQALRGSLTAGHTSTSTQKRMSEAGKEIDTFTVRWTWLGDGPPSPAPNSKLLFYHQYPELRFSGFLAGSPNAPDALRRQRLENYGERALIFGFNGQEVMGAVAAAPPRGSVELPEVKESSFSSVISELDLTLDENTEARIKDLLGHIHPCVRLKRQGEKPLSFNGPQAAGYTLEALLGVATNSDPGPDINGFELKAFQHSDTMTLMTPGADGGLVRSLGMRKFLQNHGTPGKDGTSMRFVGVQRVGKISSRGRLLEMIGPPDQPGLTESVDLTEVSSGALLEQWAGQRLSQHWLDKQNLTFYVAGIRDKETNTVVFTDYFRCEDTSPVRLMKALQEGKIYYDPAHTLKSEVLKTRSQWRVSTAKSSLPSLLQDLYQSVQHYSPRSGDQPTTEFVEDHLQPSASETISRTSQPWGGNQKREVSVRTGQGKFRQELLAKYRNVCAFSGEAPEEALEACHLSAFKEQGRHEIDNGLLLRRDLHRLFDLGLILVNPDTERIVVSEEIGEYATYAQLHDQPLKVAVSADQREWLLEHWELHTP